MADGGIEFLVAINAKYDQATQASKALDGVTAASQRTDKAVSGVEMEFQRLSKHLTTLRRPGQITEMRKEIAALENPEPAKQVGLLERAFAGAGAEAAGMIAGLGVFAVGGAIIGGISALVGKVHELGVEMLMTAGEAQRTERAIGLLMGVDVAPDILDWIDQLARTTEFTDGPLKEMAINLTRVGFKGQDLSRAMSAAVDVASMYTNKVEGVAVATEKLSRIRLKGGLGDRDLLGLGIAPDAFYKKLGQDLGMGSKEVEKKLQEGKIRVEDVIESVYAAIAAKTGKPLGGAGLAMTSTFLSQLEKAKDIIPNLFEGLSQSGGLDNITAALGRLVSNLAPDSPNGKRIIDGLEKMLNAFANLLGKVDMDKFSATAIKLFEALPPLIEASAKALLIFANVLERVISRGSLSGGIGESVGRAIGLGDKGASAFGTLTEWVKDPFGKLGSTVADSMTKGMASGINAGSPAVYDAMGNAVSTADQGLRDAAEIHSPSRRFARLGAMTAAGYEEGIRDSAPMIRDALQLSFVPPMTGPLLPDGYQSPAAPAGAPPSTGHSISASIEINIGTVTGDEKGARMVAEEGGASLRTAFQRLAEELFAEGM